MNEEKNKLAWAMKLIEYGLRNTSDTYDRFTELIKDAKSRGLPQTAQFLTETQAKIKVQLDLMDARYTKLANQFDKL